jgi:hypothetical protein
MVVAQPIDIKNLILTIRGAQVLLDSDVAMLYGYETRRINETANRNSKRFPENFRFQLTKEETNDVAFLMSQFATSKMHGGRRKLPYAYTEQGIAMLAGLLKNDTAIQVSIGIMQAFVEMRRFISAYGKAFERISAVEYKLIEHDKKFDELFDVIQSPHKFKQGVFFKGQMYDAFKLIMDIIRSAGKSIVIVDNYADDSILEMLAKKRKNVSATIVTEKPGRISPLAKSKFTAQYPGLQVVKSDEFHDRFIFIDDEKLYHVGASLKDAGKKCFALTLIEDIDVLAISPRIFL